jgi:hypothetical protein
MDTSAYIDKVKALMDSYANNLPELDDEKRF